VKIFPVILLLLFLSGCASTGDFDMVRRDVNDLRRESVESKKEIDSLKEKTTGVVKEDSFAAVRENQAEINSRLAGLSNSVQELRGRFEEYKYSMEKTLKDVIAERDIARAQIAAVETQIKALKDKLASLDEAARPREAAQKPAEGQKTEPEQAKAETKGEEQAKEPADEKVRAYEAAYQAFKDKRYKEAREKLEAFLKDYPKDKLAGNAQFWIAETYYAEKDFESAILAYETLLKKYPEGEKTSGALLKQGLSFIEIGDKKTGKTILTRLLEKYPNSKEAALAKKKISELEKKPAGKKR
jgi:tol-pal system protein YbgF